MTTREFNERLKTRMNEKGFAFGEKMLHNLAIITESTTETREADHQFVSGISAIISEFISNYKSIPADISVKYARLSYAQEPELFGNNSMTARKITTNSINALLRAGGINFLNEILEPE